MYLEYRNRLLFFKHQTSKLYLLTSSYLYKLQPYLTLLKGIYVYTFQLSSDTYLIYAFFLSLFLFLFFRGVAFRLQPYICYTKRHIGIQILKEKGFNFELYEFSYLLLTTYYLLHCR